MILGEPFQAMVEMAEVVRADVIVMGLHKRQALRDVFIGTTIERTIRHSRRPVIMEGFWVSSHAGVDMFRELLPLAFRGMVRAQEHLLVVGRQTAVERIAAFLIGHVRTPGEPAQVEISMSRQANGDYLGLTIETVSRLLI